MLSEIKLYKGKETILFDDESHAFYEHKTGEKLLSVTNITGIIDKSPALMGWVAKMMGEYLLLEKERGNEIITPELVDRAKKEYRKLQAEAADVGTQIHEWISQWIKGEQPEMPTDEKVVNGITAFLKFQKERKLKWVESERFVYSRTHKFAGILDAIAKDKTKLILIDFKSANAIYDEMRFQTAGYQLAYEEETGKTIKERMILRFDKHTGEFEAITLTNDKADKKAFLACLEIKKRLKEIKNEQRGN